MKNVTKPLCETTNTKSSIEHAMIYFQLDFIQF